MRLDPITVLLVTGVRSRSLQRERSKRLESKESHESGKDYSELTGFKPGGHSRVEPLLPIPNRTVKRLHADDSELYFLRK